MVLSKNIEENCDHIARHILNYNRHQIYVENLTLKRTASVGNLNYKYSDITCLGMCLNLNTKDENFFYYSDDKKNYN